MCLAVSDTRLWTGDSKGVFRIWDTETYQLVTECDTERRSIYAMICVQIADIETVWLGTRDDLQIRDAKVRRDMVLQPRADRCTERACSCRRESCWWSSRHQRTTCAS